MPSSLAIRKNLAVSRLPPLKSYCPSAGSCAFQKTYTDKAFNPMAFAIRMRCRQ